MLTTIVVIPSDFKTELFGLKPHVITDEKQMFTLPDEDPLLLSIDEELMIKVISALTGSGMKVAYPSDVISDEFNPTSNLRGLKGFKSVTTVEAMEMLRVDPILIDDIFGADAERSSQNKEETDGAGLDDYEPE
jgi:hypothetical protein